MNYNEATQAALDNRRLEDKLGVLDRALARAQVELGNATRLVEELRQELHR